MTSSPTLADFVRPSEGMRRRGRDAPELVAAETSFERAAGAFLGAGAGARAGGEASKQFDREIQGGMWRIVEAWLLARVRMESGGSSAKFGVWMLEPEESIAIDAGLLHAGLIRDEKAQSRDQLIAAFERREGSLLDVRTFSQTFTHEYRTRLGVEDCKQLVEAVAAAEARVDALTLRLSERMAAQRAFLASLERGQELLRSQAELDFLTPALAQLSHAFRKGGLESDELRKEMKLRETIQNVQLRIQEAIGVYNKRKEYEERQREIIADFVECAGAEMDHLRAIARERARSKELTEERRLAACRESLAQMRHWMMLVSKSDRNDAPPYHLEHWPRLTPKSADEIWQHLLCACPRFSRLQYGQGAGKPAVELLPGIGNAIVDRESRRVLASIFPTEVKLTGIALALGELYLFGDPELLEHYSALTSIGTRETGKLAESFRTHLNAWLTRNPAGKSALDSKVEAWFQQHIQLIPQKR